MQEFLLQACVTSSEIRIARGAALTPEFCESKLREFSGAMEVLGVTFKVDGKLLACVDPVVSIGDYLLPDFRRPVMFAAALGH